MMSIWLNYDLVKDQYGFLEHYKKNGIKIALKFMVILRRILKLCFGVVLEVEQ